MDNGSTKNACTRPPAAGRNEQRTTSNKKTENGKRKTEAIRLRRKQGADADLQ